ncbi:hypothetical protein FOCC_FOCC014960 [Frankliniella occidentalis]|nr:hypothetical protein FOCC_FOCC014960 [Frankliniella occidentalis]
MCTRLWSARGAVLLLPQHGRAPHDRQPLGALAGDADDRAATERQGGLRQLDHQRHGVVHHGPPRRRQAGCLPERPQAAAAAATTTATAARHLAGQEAGRWTSRSQPRLHGRPHVRSRRPSCGAPCPRRQGPQPPGGSWLQRLHG